VVVNLSTLKRAIREQFRADEVRDDFTDGRFVEIQSHVARG